MDGGNILAGKLSLISPPNPHKDGNPGSRYTFCCPRYISCKDRQFNNSRLVWLVGFKMLILVRAEKKNCTWADDLVKTEKIGRYNRKFGVDIGGSEDRTVGTSPTFRQNQVHD